MDLLLYPLLGKRSRNALKRLRRGYGKNSVYTPRKVLLDRLKAETGLDDQQIYQQLLKEREYLTTGKNGIAY